MKRFLKKTTPIKRLLLLNAVAGGENLTELTETGNPVAFSTDVAKALTECTVLFSPVQSGSGDPSPENVRPITGWTGVDVWRTGKNLFDKSTPIARGQYSSGTYQSDEERITTDYISIKPNVDYMMSIDTDNTEDLAFINYNYFDKDKTWLGNRATNGDTVLNGEKTHSFKITNSDAYFLRISIRAYSNSSKSIADKTLENAELQLELGTTATPYSPYTGQSYPVTFPDEVGTVYGGSLDLTTGVLTVTWAIKTYDGSNDEEIRYSTSADNLNFYTIKEELLPSVQSNRDPVKRCICDKLVGCSGAIVSDSQTRASGQIAVITNNRFYILMGNNEIEANATAFRGWLSENNITICYELATPLTWQLTPQQITSLIGDNTIWSDVNGDLTVKFLKKV